jgi:hypothetical protein
MPRYYKSFEGKESVYHPVGETPPPLLSRRGVWTRVDAVGKASLSAQHCGKAALIQWIVGR